MGVVGAMGVIDVSMESMIGTYVLDTSTLLDELDEILLNGEKNKSLSEDSINEIFRIMHTIKGSSAMMGIQPIATLAHRVEDLFYIIREHTELMSGDNAVLFDLLFRSSDFFKAEMEAIQNTGMDYEPSSSDDLIAMIAEQIDGVNRALGAGFATDSSEPAAAEPAAEPSSTENSGVNTVRVFFEEGCQMEHLRAFMLIQKLSELCDQIDSVPNSPESDASTCAEIISNGLLISFKTQQPVEEVYAAIDGTVNVRSYEVVSGSEAQKSATPTKPAPVEAPQTENKPQPAPAAQPAQRAATPSSVDSASHSKQSLISVNQSKLDMLMDIMGEIVIAEAMVVNNPDLKGLNIENFNRSTRQLRKLTDQLQDIVMSIRMVPINGVFQKMNRIVRDMNKKLGKDVELVTEGGDTEIDKTINDVLGDPFMHMIRNSMDHAIELPQERIAAGKNPVGKITLSAENVGGEIVITIRDDGRGLNREKILDKAEANGMLTKPRSAYSDREAYSMIMLPGFSTKEQVTEFSGRGVGMDVVRQNIERVSGSLNVDSEMGVGTVFTVKIPLTLAIVDGMTVAVADETFTLPITSIQQTFKLSADTQVISDTSGAELIMVRGECYPIVRLHSVFSVENAKEDFSEGIFLLTESSGSSICIFADELLGEQQVVVKPFPTYLSRYDIKGAGLAGCTIMGNGNISLILDINTFIKNS